MKTLGNIGMVLAILLVLTAGTAMAEAQTYQSNEKIPYNGRFWVPCANDGNGEWVRLTGDLHALLLVTFDENGGRHVASHFQSMGITGYGEVTRDKYQAAGVTRHDQNFQPAAYPLEYTYVNNFWIVGPGQGNNVLVHETYHITLNGSGEVTAETDNFWAECR